MLNNYYLKVFNLKPLTLTEEKINAAVEELSLLKNPLDEALALLDREQPYAADYIHGEMTDELTDSERAVLVDIASTVYFIISKYFTAVRTTQQSLERAYSENVGRYEELFGTSDEEDFSIRVFFDYLVSGNSQEPLFLFAAELITEALEDEADDFTESFTVILVHLKTIIDAVL